jgi:hypothetical protein
MDGAPLQAAEKVVYFVIPSEARNLSSIWPHEKKERFLASLGMTKSVGPFFRSPLSRRRGVTQPTLALWQIHLDPLPWLAHQISYD